MIFGSARFTMVWSSLPRKVPMMTVSRMRPRYEDGRSWIAVACMRLFHDPYARRHSVLEIGILERVVLDLHFELLLLALVGNVEDDVAFALRLADALDRAFEIPRAVSVEAEARTLSHD